MQTMLCDDCNADYSDHPSMLVFRDISNSLEARRHAAIVLLSLSRKRKRIANTPNDKVSDAPH